MKKPIVNHLGEPVSSREFSGVMANGLSDVLGFTWNLGNPGIGTQLSQADTLFDNLRWYMVSNLRQLLSQMYVESGLIQTVVDVPVADGLRGGVDLKTGQLDETQIQHLQARMEEENDLGVYAEALGWARLFGGAGVLCISGQDRETPLDIDAIQEGDRIAFKAVDMWELYYDLQNVSGDGDPLDYDDTHAEYFNYYGKKIHRSRIQIIKGMKAPSFVRPRLRGWGISVVEPIVKSINQYLKANNLTFEVLDEFKVDYYKIKNLTSSLMSPQGSTLIQQRIQLANQQKNFNNAVVMDGEDDFTQKELSFAGIAETMIGIRMQVASDLRMPLTKIFGISAAGFSSGEDDIENYNAMVESQIREKSKWGILKMIKLRCRQYFGFAPTDLTIHFKPLRILSAEQEETVKTQKFQRLMQATQTGYMTTKEFKDAVNKENLLCVQLDADLEKLDVETEVPYDG